jgi:hypothetical protein
MKDREPRPGQQTAGAISLFAGIALLAVALLDAGYGLPWQMPRTWYLHRLLWGVLGLGLGAFGWFLQRSRAGLAPRWKPAIPGRRFHRLVVYSRAECHLCDDAKAVLAGYLDYLPDIEEIDIDSDADLKARFDTSVPVVELDGVVRFRGRVDEILLRRLIEGTPPN